LYKKIIFTSLDLTLSENSSPKFVFDDGSENTGSQVVLQITEGPEYQEGTLIARYNIFDDDGSENTGSQFVLPLIEVPEYLEGTVVAWYVTKRK
jgi:hypothetical protein